MVYCCQGSVHVISVPFGAIVVVGVAGRGFGRWWEASLGWRRSACTRGKDVGRAVATRWVQGLHANRLQHGTYSPCCANSSSFGRLVAYFSSDNSAATSESTIGLVDFRLP